MCTKELSNESALLNNMAAGSHKAFNELFNYYHPRVYSYALKICQSPCLAEETVQDVFMKIWANRTSLTEINNFGGYLMVMSRNQILQVLKRIAMENHCNSIKNLDWTELHKETENYINFKDTQLVLQKAISALPSQQKLVYNMCQLEGMKHQEVASQLSISRLTVKAHLRQAVKKVRAIVLSNQNLIFFIAVSQLFKK